MILLFVPALIYSAERPVTFSDARLLGMGNTFTAIADDKNMLFFNPAGFATYGLIKTSIIDALRNPTLWKPRHTNIGDLTIGSITVGVNDAGELLNDIFKDGDSKHPLMKLLKLGFFNDPKKWFDVNNLSINDIAKLTNMGDVRLPIVYNIEAMSYARTYFGFGLFSSGNADIEIDSGDPLASVPPTVKIRMNSDIIFALGVGIPIPGHKKWAVGLTAKYFQRLRINAQNTNDFQELERFKYEPSESQSMSGFLMNGKEHSLNDVYKFGTGYGFDLGFMYRPSYSWKYGLLLSDVYTRINWWDRSEPSRIPINARLGAAYTPKWDIGILSDPIIAIDMEDIFHQQKKNFFLKFHLGTEVKFLFRFLTLRAGINEGYPSFGGGFDLSLYFLSKLPVIKWLRPDKIYFPKFNPKDRKFVEQNPICCCLAGILAPLFYAHLKVDFSYTGYELGDRPYQTEYYQLLARVSLSYSY